MYIAAFLGFSDAATKGINRSITVFSEASDTVNGSISALSDTANTVNSSISVFSEVGYKSYALI